MQAVIDISLIIYNYILIIEKKITIWENNLL